MLELLSVKKSPVISFKYLLYDFVRLTGLPLLLWYRPKKIYASKAAKQKLKGGLILMSNHVSMRDPMYLIVGILSRRHHFVTAKELFAKKFRAWLFRKAFLCIEIDRDNFSMASFREITDHINMGDMVTMFPEGHINVDKKGVNDFKGGIVMMALKTHCPIVPVYIKKKKHLFSRLVLYIGEPIKVDDYITGKTATVNDIRHISEVLKEREEQLELLCNKDEKER